MDSRAREALAVIESGDLDRLDAASVACWARILAQYVRHTEQLVDEIERRFA